MSEEIRVSKLEAAQRQLNAGIRMLFANGDPIATHTLFGAASNLFSDLVEAKCSDQSWDKIGMEANGLSLAEYRKIMRNAQNFLKHADKDPDAVLDLALSDTEALAFSTVMNASVLPEPLTFEAQVFQLWFIASSREGLENEDFQEIGVNRWFGDLESMPRVQRLQIGQKA
ncbi:MAG TPA: hypothetical protein VN214_02260, partial [Pseudomonas sp.]|nr:hypothetical protein [Pseudomonas sp.]